MGAMSSCFGSGEKRPQPELRVARTQSRSNGGNALAYRCASGACPAAKLAARDVRLFSAWLWTAHADPAQRQLQAAEHRDRQRTLPRDVAPATDVISRRPGSQNLNRLPQLAAKLSRVLSVDALCISAASLVSPRRCPRQWLRSARSSCSLRASALRQWRPRASRRLASACPSPLPAPTSATVRRALRRPRFAVSRLCCRAVEAEQCTGTRVYSLLLARCRQHATLRIPSSSRSSDLQGLN